VEAIENRQMNEISNRFCLIAVVPKPNRFIDQPYLICKVALYFFCSHMLHQALKQSVNNSLL